MTGAPSVPGLLPAEVDPYKVPRGYGDQQRPGVIPPGEDKLVWYSRVTSFVDDLEDGEGITKWKEAHVLLGAIRRPDLVLNAAVCFDRLDAPEAEEDYYVIKAHEPTEEEKKAGVEPLRKLLWNTVDQLKVAAGVEEASLWGTLMHHVTEAFDRAGRQRSPEQIVAGIDWAFQQYAAAMRPCREVDLDVARKQAVEDLHAYAIETGDFEIVEIERFGANPDLKVGGTWDRIVHYQGRNYILDLKTGTSATAYPDKLAKQLATYVHCTPYDPVNRWQPRPFEVDQAWALVVRLPGDGTCEVSWVKIAKAWRTVAKLITEARAWRSYAKPKNLLVRHVPGGAVPTLDAVDELPESNDPRVARIAAARTGDEIRAMWHADADLDPWPAWLNQIAAVRVAELARGVLVAGGLVTVEDKQEAA
jgi:hypothetical protein